MVQIVNSYLNHHVCALGVHIASVVAIFHFS